MTTILTLMGTYYNTNTHGDLTSIIASEASFLVCSMARILYICVFQAVRHAVNVLNVSTCI